MSKYAKSIAALLATALTTLLVYVVSMVAKVTVPLEVAGAFTTIVTTLLVFFVPNAKEDA